MPQVFSPSLRAVALQSVLLATTTWLALRLGLQLDARGATLASLGALGCLLGLRVATHRPRHHVVIDDQGLRLRRGGAEVQILRDDIEGVALEAGELSDGGHALHVGFARVLTRRGPQLAFADLSALGGASLRTPDARAEIIDVADPELLLALLRNGDGASVLPPVAVDAPTPGAAEQALSPSPLNASRALAWIVGGRALFDALMAPRTAPGLALLGLALAVGAYRLAVVFARESAPERSAPIGIIASCVLALAAARGLPAVGAGSLSGWVAAGALALCAPVRPLPGGAMARALGRGLVGAPRGVRGGLLAGALLSAAALFAVERSLLALLLIAAIFEALDGMHASRRHALLTLAPERSVPELAALRARLRPFSDALPEAPTRARDHAELSLAALAPPPGAPWRSVAAVGAAIAVGCSAGARWMLM